MKCNKCNHLLPDDSEFCQYCGNKIEAAADVPDASVSTPLPDFDNVSPDETLKAILEFQARETVAIMQANSKNQPDNEDDADFGLIPLKPIYTHALKSVNGEEEYLNKLCASNGEKITWERRGSMSVDGVNGMIDIYDTYLPSGQPYKTIYINMYGAKTSKTVPSGFVFKDIAPKDFIVRNVKPLQKRGLDEKVGKDGKLIRVISKISLVAALVAIGAIIIAMNFQDMERNAHEAMNPTALYAVMIVAFAFLALVEIFSGRARNIKLMGITSTALTICTILALIEGSVFSEGYRNAYYRNVLYRNNDFVGACNTLWVTICFVLLVINYIPMIVVLFRKMLQLWRGSLRYREKCYKRVAKMYSYYQSGIMTQDEYEKMKKIILDRIKD
jgi:hypothetical protein